VVSIIYLSCHLLILPKVSYNGIINPLEVNSIMMNYLINMNRYLRITMLLSGFFGSFVLFYFTVNELFILLSFVFLGVLIASNVSHAKNYSSVMEKSLEKALMDKNFISDHYYLSDDYLSGIALNKEKSKIAIFKRFNIKEDFDSSFYDFSDIIECSIREDNATITKTSNSSLIKRTMVGGVLLGSLGSVVGALSSEKVSNEHVYKATLSLVFDDIDYPIREIDFLNSNMLVNRNSNLYQKVYDDLNRWYKTISIIIKRNEQDLNSKSV
jgi:hypothetical protein